MVDERHKVESQKTYTLTWDNIDKDRNNTTFFSDHCSLQHLLISLLVHTNINMCSVGWAYTGGVGGGVGGGGGTSKTKGMGLR